MWKKNTVQLSLPNEAKPDNTMRKEGRKKPVSLMSLKGRYRANATRCTAGEQ